MNGRNARESAIWMSLIANRLKTPMKCPIEPNPMSIASSVKTNTF